MVILAYDLEALPGVIMEAMKHQRLDGGGGRLENRMLGLVERAVEDLMRR